MATPCKEEDIPRASDDLQEAAKPETFLGWGGTIEGHYRRIKENAEAYPYVWGSYVLVYGGFGLWLTYRWRKLRKTEDRVRVLQERLRKLVEAEQAANAAAVKEQSANAASLANKASQSSERITK